MIKLPGVQQGSSNRISIGFNLGDNTCQISYSRAGEEPQTLETITGSEQFSIPTVLCKAEGEDMWFAGREALMYYADNGGILINALLSKALDGETVIIEGNGYDPVSLLTLFIQRCMGLLRGLGQERYAGVIFTTGCLDAHCLEVLRAAAFPLKLKTDKILFQSHAESFYYYMVSQPRELWNQGSLLFDYDGADVNICHLSFNLKSRPMVVCAAETACSLERSAEGEEEYDRQQADADFLEIARAAVGNKHVTSIFLIGEKFTGQKMGETKKFLLCNGRVFQGSNLFSKGACYALLCKMEMSNAAEDFIFLGSDKLTSNIGMNILCQGGRKKIAILDAGCNWYDARSSFDFYLEDGDSIEFSLDSVINGRSTAARITLEEFSGKLSRMRARVSMEDVHTLTVEIEELGFGAFRPATHKIWIEKIPL